MKCNMPHIANSGHPWFLLLIGPTAWHIVGTEAEMCLDVLCDQPWCLNITRIYKYTQAKLNHSRHYQVKRMLGGVLGGVLLLDGIKLTPLLITLEHRGVMSLYVGSVIIHMLSRTLFEVFCQIYTYCTYIVIFYPYKHNHFVLIFIHIKELYF